MNTTMATLNDTLPSNSSLVSSELPPGWQDTMYWRVWLYSVGGAFIECIGILCNIIAIIVLAHFRNKSSAPFLLICLAVLDSIYLLSILFLESFTNLAMGKLISNSYEEFILPIYSVLFPLPLLTHTCVVYLVVVITLERYTVVAWPVTAHSLWGRSSTCLAVAGVLLTGILYHIPTYCAFQYDYFVLPDGNLTNMKVFHRTKFGHSHFYNEIYMKWINLSFNFGLPFIILLAFNVLLITSLRKSRQMIVAAQNRVQREQRLTVMVICMTAIFFLCELMAGLSLALTAGYTGYTDVPREINRFAAVADTVTLLNSAINFAIYCATGRKFRETFCIVFCRCSRKRPQYRMDGRPSKSASFGGSSSRITWIKLFTRPWRPHQNPLTPTASAMSSFSSATRSSRTHSTSSDSSHAKLNTK